MIDQTNAELLELADRFNDFISLAQIRYNLMLSEENDTVKMLWNEVKESAVEYAERVDLDAIFARLHLNNQGLRDFLEKFRGAILVEDWTAADNSILKQEVRLKGARAKLKNKGKYSPDKWVGGYRLDYRFTVARRLIMDIRKRDYHV